MRDANMISWTPPWLKHTELSDFAIEPPVDIAPHEGRASSMRCLRPGADQWPAVSKGLRSAAEVLRRIPISDIMESIDAVANQWLDRRWLYRKATRDLIASLTGMSPESVDHSLDLELRNYRRIFLERALERELKDSGVLDGFHDDSRLAGKTMAIGPNLLLAVLTGNVPGLPALEIVRALLLKSAVVVKVASGEPIFAAQFARSLLDVDPRLADAVLVTYWSRDDIHTLSSVTQEADAVVIYGGRSACAAIRAVVPAGKIILEHGHKASYGILTKAYLTDLGLEEVALRVAEDVCAFNQHACISPQAYLIEGEDIAQAMSAALARAMKDYQRRRPLGIIPDDDVAALALRRASMEWRTAVSGSPSFCSERSLNWTVMVDKSSYDRTQVDDMDSGYRFIRLLPVRSLTHAIDVLRPWSGYLQNVALGASAAELAEVAEKFARLGASRICEPGQMASPSFVWRHDGRSWVGDLVRWCDIEMHTKLQENESEGASGVAVVQGSWA